MNRTVQILFASAVLLGVVACETAGAQQEPQASRTVTEVNNPTESYNSVRVIKTEREENGRKITTETVEAPSASGGYEAIRKTEQETIQVDANTVRVVQRWFSPGDQQAFQMSEEERRTGPGGQESVVRTISTLDLGGRWQVQERNLEETVSTGPDAKKTTKTVLGTIGGNLTPVLQSEEIERRNGNSVEAHRRLLRPDGRGEFQVFEEQKSVATQTKEGRTTEEKRYRNDGYGQMTVIEQTVGRESQNGEQKSEKVSQKYSIYVPGMATDGQLHLVQEQSESTGTASGGETRTEKQTRQIYLGAPGNGLRTTTIVSETSKPLGKSGTETHTEVRGLNPAEASGDLMLIRVTDSKKTREIR